MKKKIVVGIIFIMLFFSLVSGTSTSKAICVPHPEPEYPDVCA